MFVMTMKFNKKTAALIIVLAALILIGVVFLAGAHSSKEESGTNTAITTVKNEKDRIKYLAQYGWEVESPAIAEEKVIIPREFSDIYTKYNELQLKQDFDLSRYSGNEVDLYTYKVKNFRDDENIVAQLYIYHGTVIGGDVHSTKLDGFISGIR